jgi:DNA modification methylase
MGGCKPKDLIGIPWMLAFALRDDGWYLRQDIRWSKPNPMPESVTDRCTKSHEYVFLLSKSKRYYFDHKAIMEPAVYPTGSRKDRRNSNSKRMKTPGAMMQGVHCSEKLGTIRDFRNKRDVWAVPTAAYKGAHFATFPPALIEPCILAGTPEGGVVLDPFTGSGTVAEVALKSFRHFVGIDLNPDYIKIAENRVASLLAQQRLDL